jgi:proline iminopeptidase
MAPFYVNIYVYSKGCAVATAEVNQTTLFYTPFGHGPTCLVMHGGLGIDHTMYRSLDPLGEHMRLIYYDHRGNGRSGRLGMETLTIEQRR